MRSALQEQIKSMRGAFPLLEGDVDLCVCERKNVLISLHTVMSEPFITSCNSRDNRCSMKKMLSLLTDLYQ